MTIEETTQVTDTSSAPEVDIDAIEQEAASRSNDIPMSAPKAEPQAAPQEFELQVNGKTVKANLDQMRQWAQLGYNYPQRVGQVNQQLQSYQQQLEAAQSQLSQYKPYQEIDQYMRQNPDFWNHVQESWKGRQQVTADPNNPLSKELLNIKNEFGQVKGFLSELQQERLVQQQVKEDQSLDQEVKSIRTQYPNIDFDSLDQEGKSLEFRILEHASKSGIQSFKTAFADFYLPNLLKQAEERGKENVTRTQQRNAKLGILGKTPTPTQFAQPKDIRSKTYNDIAEEVLAELQAGRS